MFRKVFGVVLLVLGLNILLGAVFSFSNQDWPMKKALVVGGIQLVIAIIPLVIGVKLFRKKVAVEPKEEL